MRLCVSVLARVLAVALLAGCSSNSEPGLRDPAIHQQLTTMLADLREGGSAARVIDALGALLQNNVSRMGKSQQNKLIAAREKLEKARQVYERIGPGTSVPKAERDQAMSEAVRLFQEAGQLLGEAAATF
jgi:hypothetical protein